jgi:Lrp/AsnC family leucine-responsive transcriptional regulator
LEDFEILQQNARMSNAEIEERVGISSPAVSELQLRRWKIPDYTGYTFVSPFEVGYQLKALITLAHGRIKTLLRKVKNL